MKNSRAKGKCGELELSKVLTELFGATCRRSQQYYGASGDSDVVGLDGIFIECKRVEKLNIDNAMAQAVSDAKNGDIPVVCHRRNRGEWLLTVRLADAGALAAVLAVKEPSGPVAA